MYRLKQRSLRRRTCLSLLIFVIITYASFSSVHFLRSNWSRLIACKALTPAVSSINLSKFLFWSSSRSLRFLASYMRVMWPAIIPSYPFWSFQAFIILPRSLKTLALSDGFFSMCSSTVCISAWKEGSCCRAFFIFAGDIS